jgi:hypothetical protein
VASPFSLNPTPLSRTERIRRAFLDLTAQIGRDVSSKELADYCISSGVFLGYELRQITRAGVQKVCRDALTARDHANLPWAGPTGPIAAAPASPGGPMWRQRAFWDYPIYEFNIAERVEGRNELHLEAVKLRDECQIRFGRAPTLPPLP